MLCSLRLHLPTVFFLTLRLPAVNQGLALLQAKQVQCLVLANWAKGRASICFNPMLQMDLSCLLQLDLSCFDIMLLFPSVRFIQIWISLSGAQLGGRRGEQVFRVN